MSTNFPAGLDTTTELGTTFTNTIAVTDPVTQIDATYRVNAKDAIMAIEARLGITNSTVPTSLSWATMSIGGTDNLGLRFAGSSATWPGLVAETGVFLDSATGFPAFHYAGDAVGVFYPLTASGLVVSLQAAYNTSGAVTTSGADDLAFTIAAGDDFTVTHAAGTHTVLSGAATTLTSGLLDINCTAIAATAVPAVNTQITNSVNNQEFGAYLADVQNAGDLATTELIYGFAAALDMSGDGPAAPGLALGAAFYARNSTFTGANEYETTGLLVDSTFDWGLRSEAPLYVDTPVNLAGVQLDSDPASFTGAVTIAAVGTDARSGFISCIEGTVDTPVAIRFFVRADGAATVTTNSANPCLSLNQSGSGVFIQCTDPGGPTTRFRVDLNGTTYFYADAASAAAGLLITHSAATEPFFDFAGTYAALAANGNVTDENAGGAVVGPGATTWTFAGMYRQEISTGGGGIPAGDYWVPLFTHV